MTDVVFTQSRLAVLQHFADNKGATIAPHLRVRDLAPLEVGGLIVRRGEDFRREAAACPFFVTRKGWATLREWRPPAPVREPAIGAQASPSP